MKNHKKYIGLTNNIQRRRNRHFTDLRCGRHDNSFLQKEVDIYGLNNFSFEEIYSGDITSEEISKLEEYYIDLYDSYYNGYNQNKGGHFGPANGGSHLIKSDILNILAVCEFTSRPGQLLGDIFNVTRTTIGRIKKGENHCEIYEEYHSMPLEQRKDIFNIFCESYNFNERLEQNHKLQSKRTLNKEDVFMVLVNRELKIMPEKVLGDKIGIKHSNIYNIGKNTYKDFFYEYNKLSFEEKQKYASLLSNK